MGTGRFSFIRLPGRKHRPAARPADPDLGLFLHGRGDYAFDVIGIAPFGELLRGVASGRTWSANRQECLAALICREGTPLERNTVAIEIGGNMVGYCPSSLATQYREWLGKWGFIAARVQCNAMIIGRPDPADGHMSAHALKLDIELPFKATRLSTW